MSMTKTKRDKEKPPMTDEQANDTVTLSDEISALLNDPARTAAKVGAMLARIGSVIERSRQRAAAARHDALDPRQSWASVNALRAAADEAEFEAERMVRAGEELENELAALEKSEAEEARVARYRAATARAETCAARIRAEYPALAKGLVALLAEIADATRDVVAVNRDLPADAPMLQGPEGLARGFNDCAGTKPKVEPMRLCEAVIPPLAVQDRALWPRDRLTVWGVNKSTLDEKYIPYGNWPSVAQVRASLEDAAQLDGA